MEEQDETHKESERRHSIQLRAYRLWEQRGHPWGTPEIDWFVAEHELRPENQDVVQESLTVTAAKVVGSVLGSVTGILASVTNSLPSE